MIVAAAAIVLPLAAFCFWRYVWFFRDPPRSPPAEEGLVSPADGTVVYVKRAAPGEKVLAIKEGLAASIDDIARSHMAQPKLVVGVFMSPFDVHYNRVPFAADVVFTRRHAAIGHNVHMGEMHLRSLLGIEPLHAGSRHIVQNERTVTAFAGRYRGRPLEAYVVQIGALTVNGIESYVHPGQRVARGEVFGMIRVGSQVDLILPWRDDLTVAVKAGDRVRAGETILVR